MKRLTSFTLFISLGAILSAEPSVYGDNIGGIYASEKSIARNTKTIFVLQRKLTQYQEQIDGLRSIIEGLSATVHTLEQKAHKARNSVGNGSDSELLKELGTMIDKINNNYVSKEELKNLLEGKSFNTKASNETTKKEIVKKNIDSIEGKTAKVLYSEAVRYFVKKRYDEAKKRFLITDSKRHKPAASNYYLGEISYYTKQYEDAIFYYKKSAGLYDKASYIDTLLLHTAISLEKNGDKEQARAFYENIIENYKGKKTANIAKNKLKKL